MSDVRDFIYGAIKGVLIRVRRFRESAQLPNELKGRCANLVVRRRRCKIMQGLNVSAHEESLAADPPSATLRRDKFHGCTRILFATSTVNSVKERGSHGALRSQQLTVRKQAYCGLQSLVSLAIMARVARLFSFRTCKSSTRVYGT